jgi:hypothetical protein
VVPAARRRSGKVRVKGMAFRQKETNGQEKSGWKKKKVQQGGSYRENQIHGEELA